MTISQGDAQLFIGIHLTDTLLRGAVVNQAGETLREVRVDPDLQDSQRLFEQTGALVRDLRSERGVSGRFTGIGLCVPGLVNHSTRRIEVVTKLPRLAEMDVVAEIERESGLPVVLDNDANAAAYAELLLGAARDRRDVFFVMLGSSVGSGIIIDGRVYRGATGFAGEFGHITIDPEGIECACGNIGCLETFASTPNIVRRTRERLYRDRTSSLSKLAVPRDREFTAEDIAHAAQEGDEMAQLMMERTGMFLGIGLAAVINMLNVDTIVLAGGVMEAGDFILKATTNEARRRAFPPSFKSCQIVIAQLGPSASVTGAALLARDQRNSKH
jgi:glucokinase